MHDLEISDYVFEKPLLLEIPKSDMEKIMVEEMAPYQTQLAESDLLLVYTGFSKVRKTDPKRYVTKQPSFSVDAANYLVDNFNLRGFGVDLIGIENIPEAKDSTPQFPVHRALLLKKQRKAILVEDIDKMEQLGIYEVSEEDFALCEFVCASKIEIQSIIRQGMDLMMKEVE